MNLLWWLRQFPKSKRKSPCRKLVLSLHSSFHSPFFLYVLLLVHDFINPADFEMGTEPELEPMTAEEARGLLPTTQAVEVQTGIS